MPKWIIPVVLLLLIEYYSFIAFKTAFKSSKLNVVYILVSILTFCFIVYGFFQFDRSVGQTKQTLFTLGLMLLFLIPKFLIVVPLLLEDFYRLGKGIFNYVQHKPTPTFLPERRRFISQVALGLAAIPFGSLIYGMTKGKYNFKVIKQTVFFDDLPEAFNGFKIIQISDVHSGSFDNKEKIEYAIDLINQQEADMMLFTGDIVNSLASEMHPWIDTFRKIKSFSYGKYAVLGNHDYGEYLDWKGNKNAKAQNFEEIKQLYGDIGFTLLLNENKTIQKDNDALALIGVENWGLNFKQAGDLNKASQGVQKHDFKVLMSHDPSHWDVEVQNHPKNYQLTLSGHTHGLQFGIEIPGFLKWSPVSFKYPHWAGLYENQGRYLYVNRGFGFHAYPGRVGIMPEITVLELKKR